MIVVANDPATAVITAATVLYGARVVAMVQYDPTLKKPRQGGGWGVTVIGKGHPPLISINIDLPIRRIPEIVAHELAHVIAGERAGHGPKWEKVFSAIHEQYTKHNRTGLAMTNKNDWR